MPGFRNTIVSSDDGGTASGRKWTLLCSKSQFGKNHFAVFNREVCRCVRTGSIRFKMYTQLDLREDVVKQPHMKRLRRRRRRQSF